MNVQTLSTRSYRYWLERALVVFVTAFLSWGFAQAATAPEQQPLLSVSTGASPNVMLSIDNSGSMLAPYLDSYPFKAKGTTATGVTEYYNWSCSGAGYTGPYRDEEGDYYCKSTTVKDACPYGFTGPVTSGGSTYCERKDPVYSCPTGYTGPTADLVNGGQICSQVRYTYSCSDPAYSITGTTDANRTCKRDWVEYSCPATGYTGPALDGGVQKCTSTTSFTYSCPAGTTQGAGADVSSCFAYKCASGWTLGVNGGVQSCKKTSFFTTTWDLTKLTTTKTAATKNYAKINATATNKTDSQVSLVVAQPYNSTQAATVTQVTNQYDNVQESTKDTRFYGNSPYTTGVVRALSRTKIGSVDIAGGSYYAMRSAQVNPLYYDPNKTYTPRVNYTGSGDYEAPPTGFVKDAGKGNEIEWELTNNPMNYNYGGTGYYYPKLSKVSNPGATDEFVYVNCSTYNASTCTIQNTASQVVRVTKDTTSVNLPAGHLRTDCGGSTTAPATTCTGAKERQNILNWYTYYQTRADITATSVGFAMANAAYSGKMRVGFYNINRYISNSNYQNKPGANWDGSHTLTVSGKNYPFAKGVRPFELGASTANTTNTKPVFDWLYSQKAITAGGTPLHNAVKQVADYYQADEPWYGDPIKSSTGQLACRRAYNILFSDGAWSDTTQIDAGSVPYNSTALKPQTIANGPVTLTPPFTYSKFGDSFNLGSYIAYPDSGNGYSESLAAITSNYYWGRDLKSTIANELTTRPGEPTSWQNMKTYTIGYGIAPTGFTYDDIKSWQKSFSKLGYQSDLVPKWPTSKTAESARIDDFIHAGYTGGGSSFSVRTADEIQRAFDLVLSDVVSASGNDAGVAVSGASSSVSTIEGSLKYTVDYKTLDNSGDVKAWKLDAAGSNASVNAMWSAKDNMPRPVNRNMSTRGSTGVSTLSHATTLASLPADIQLLLKNGNTSLATDASFIKYLRGEEGVTDPNGDVYRRRSSLIAASVNAPPVYVGGRLNMGYDRGQSAVSGKLDYTAFTADKGKIPGALYAPTNDGQVHVINAADDTAVPAQKIKNSTGSVIAPGTELWSYLIRGSLSKMQAFADPAYNFEYVLDGPLAEHDIYDSTGAGSWKQMLFGTLGRAGKSVYALNAALNKSDPNNLNRIPNAAGYQWEVAPAHMGNVTNALTAGQTKKGDWVVLANSGHYANTGEAGLYVLDALTGATIKFIQLPTGYSFGRGLSGVTAIRDASRRIVGAYAGDAGGNLWRFDLLDINPANWGVSYGKPLFTTPGNQPIYVAPAWVPHPGDGKALPDGCVNKRVAQDGAGVDFNQQCGAMVIFGTGMLLDADDKLNTSMQTIYGIWDKTPIGLAQSVVFQPITKSTLLQQEILTAKTVGTGGSAGKDFYKVSSNTIDWAVHRGWYLDLSKLPNSTGERVIGDVFNLGSNVFVSSVVVNNGTAVDEETCTVKASPPNFLYGVDALSGGSKRAFDQNGDGKADQFSIAYIPGGGFTRGSVITQTSKEGSSSTAGLGLPNEGDPDLSIKNKCTGEQGFDTGITGSVQVFDGCPAGWNRAWRQILVPPVF